MKKYFSISILFFSMALLAGACRPTPAPQRGPSEVPAETTLIEPAGPTESVKPTELPDVPATLPEQEMIARHLPESLIAAPERDLAPSRVEYNTVINSRMHEAGKQSAWRYRVTRQGKIVGFEFSNYGGNRILPPRRDAVKNKFFTRDFQFRFDERARQDIHLMVSDWVPSRDQVFRLSELMNSVLLFFPRTYLPAIVNWQNRHIVTLPTGEVVEFDAVSHEIMAGVLSESPVDLNPDRMARKFPGIEYRGKGVFIRADSRGADPRTGDTTVITNGSPAENCDRGISCRQCEVPAKELWDQGGAARFRFATDAEFDRYLTARCGFALPRLGTELAVARP
jgi:hypothetical protein